MKKINPKIIKLQQLANVDQSKGGKRARYSAAVKILARELYADGQSISSLAAATGINGNSIRKWAYINCAPQYSNRSRFRDVPVAESSSLEVILPNGVKLKGLSFEQLMELAEHATAA